MNHDEVFLELYDGHYKRILFQFKRWGLDQEDARDLTQETFARVYKGMKSYRGDAVGSYLDQIAGNVWKNYLRYWDAELRSGEEVPVDDSVLSVPDQTDTVLDLVDHERKELLKGAIQELPARTKRCFRLWLKGLKYREIAAVMEISLDTVKSLIYQGKQRLREKLGDTDLATGPPAAPRGRNGGADD